MNRYSKLIPQWILREEKITRRQWKEKKRREFNLVLKAFDDFRYACYYTPSGRNGNIEILEKALENVQHDLSQKIWGR